MGEQESSEAKALFDEHRRQGGSEAREEPETEQLLWCEGCEKHRAAFEAAVAQEDAKFLALLSHRREEHGRGLTEAEREELRDIVLDGDRVGRYEGDG